MRDFSVQSGKKTTVCLVKDALGLFIRKDENLPVLLCIGSDRITGDSLGPLVGHFLTAVLGAPCFVYGTLKETVNAKNVVDAAAFIAKKHPRSKIIAVDAALGKPEDVGRIRIRGRGVVPAAAMGRPLGLVGDYSITAVVNVLSDSSAFLHNTRLGDVWRMSDEIARGVAAAISYKLQKLKATPEYYDNSILSFY